MGSEADDDDVGPPPRHAVRCPTPLEHCSIGLREDAFFCAECGRQYEAIVDARTDDEIGYDEFIERWGRVEYRSWV